MPTHPESPLPRDVAVESRENEGGPYPSLPSASIVPSNVSPVVRDQATESSDLAAMRERFLADFAGGAMGRHRRG